MRLRDQSENERLFRINAGMGWSGKIITLTEALQRTIQQFYGLGEYMLIKNPRPFHAAPKGWHDMCGWGSVEVTQEMVGQRVAIFKFVEVKLTGKLSKGQIKFKELLERMGGLTEVITK